MNKLSLCIENLQHIKKLDFEIDISKSGIMAIVGKNGVGKTMLFKAIQNFTTSNTFKNTSNNYIYKNDSKITYHINENEETYQFTYNSNVETLDYKGEVNSECIDKITVELPIPFGERFKQFQKLGNQDKAIRAAIISGNTSKPEELIDLLNYIYDSNKFDNLVEINIKLEKFYAIELEDSLYIREDYLSSGEYFIVNIYKYIKEGKKLIAIDEIDISLDSMAQVRFIEKLRELSKEYELKLLFSTHSLALIKTLDKDELFYMELNNGICTYEKKSYNYIKSLLYGFHDYDKYILTEDTMLNSFIEYLLKNENIFPKYILLEIGGDVQVISLMDRNHVKEIFDKQQNVISVLDGDKSHMGAYNKREDILFLPFKSIEKDFFEYFKSGEFGSFSDEQLRSYNFQGTLNDRKSGKKIYEMFINNKLKSEKEIFDFLCLKNKAEVQIFKDKLVDFLNR
ncbi:MAG: AAA family ATPase [Arcobacter sp.]|uniref:AAA family ATPase n=1 Tax=Arcobacter sp. TaxID=1872629 RepID=UPI003AFFCA38